MSNATMSYVPLDYDLVEKINSYEKIVHLFTPGLDSFLSNWYLSVYYRGKNEPTRVYFDIRSVYSSHEIELLHNFRHDPEYPYVIIDTSLYMGDLEQPSAYIPNRNLAFVVLASARYDADLVLINGMKDDRVSDNRKSFFDRASELISESLERKVEIRSFFWHKEKAEVLYEYNRYYNYDIAAKAKVLCQTFSCYSSILESLDEAIKKYGIYTVTTSFVTPYAPYRPLVRAINEDPRLEFARRNRIYIGCMMCKACFRRFAALTALEIYIPFLNKELIESYRTGDNKIDETDMPYRHKHTFMYLNFLDWWYMTEKRYGKKEENTQIVYEVPR